MLSLPIQNSRIHLHSDCKIFHGAAVVHALPSTTVSTFDSYAENVFIPFILNHLQSSKRMDIVWDVYKANSIKDSTREKRVNGQRRKVTGETKIPPNRNAFLQDNSERTLCSPDKQTSKLPVSREQGSKHHLRPICCHKQRL